LAADSEVITFQIRTLAKKRFKNRLGEISKDHLSIIKESLNDILTY